MPTILVVDDEYGVGEVIEAILADEGHRVVTAVNGRQGLQRLSEAQPDLVLLDVVMPIMDGPAMLAAMRADPALAGVPVVMMSSLDEASVRERTQGFAAFLRKPFRSAAIIEAVVRALDGVVKRPSGQV